jgi:hypothetical protein
LCGCETWSVTLRDEHRLRIFISERVEVTGGWSILHNEELHNLYSSPNIIRMRLAGYEPLIGEKRPAYRVLGGKPKGKS